MSDLITGILSTSFGLWVFFQGLKLKVFVGKMTGPGLFPVFIGIVLTGLGLILLISKGIKKSKALPGKNKENKSSVFHFPPSVFLSGLCLLYILAISHVHFILLTTVIYFTMAFITAFITNVLSMKTLIVSGTTALGVSVGIYLLFKVIFKVPV